MEYKGLSEKQADAVRKESGSNELGLDRGGGFLRELIAALGDPIMKTLLGAMALNIILSFRSREWYEPVGIALAVFAACLVSALSEYGSETAFLKLQREAGKKKCRLVRDGAPRAGRWSEIVEGDIVLLQAGEAAPADGLLIEGELSADQSAVNGESREVKKRAGGRDDRDPSAPSSLLRGTVITEGEGVMRVTRVGKNTLYGSAVSDRPPEDDSPMRARLTALSRTVSALGYIAAALVAVITLYKELWLDNGQSLARLLLSLHDTRALLTVLLDAATLAISVLVVAVPEGLPMMITVALSKNMMKMTRDNVMVRKPVGIETAGSMNILFCDKTGTLTRGRIRVSGFITPDGRTVPADGASPALERELAPFCFACSSALPSPSGAIGGNATDRAMLDWALERGLAHGSEREELLPFTSQSRVSAARAGGRVYIKGAPEVILPRAGGSAALSRALSRQAGEGKRILALAEAASMPGADGLPRMRLAALCVLEDILRPGAREAVRQIQGAGIQVVMLTGDSPATAAAIAESAGIRPGRAVEGRDIEKMDDNALCAALPEISVIARAMPAHKSRLVAAARRMGLTAGMTGDGVNDAPALRAADVGFAMGSGTEVAKQAGDIIILDDNIASIARAVLYGRTIFRSIRKFIVFQLTMNLCAVGVSILSPLIGVSAPITVMQMLWINLIMDTLAGLAFSGEPTLGEYMLEPPKSRLEPILRGGMVWQILLLGGWTLAVSLWFLRSGFIRAFFRPHPDDLYLMTGFFALFVFSGVCAAFTARTARIRLLRDKNPFFFGVMAVVSLVQLALIYPGGTLFRTAPLTLRELALTLGLALTVIPVDILRKLVIKRRGRLTKKRKRSIKGE